MVSRRRRASPLATAACAASSSASSARSPRPARREPHRHRPGGLRLPALLPAGPQWQADTHEGREEVGPQWPGAIAGGDGEIGTGAELLHSSAALRGFEGGPAGKQPGMVGDGGRGEQGIPRSGKAQEHLFRVEQLIVNRSEGLDIAKAPLAQRPPWPAASAQFGVLRIETRQCDAGLERIALGAEAVAYRVVAMSTAVTRSSRWCASMARAVTTYRRR